MPTLPPRTATTGDAEIDAVLWLRAVIDTGEPAMIAKALEAAEQITTPAKVLEKRYADHLVRQSGGHPIASLGAFDFADLKGYAERTVERQRRQHEAVSRFGSEEAVFADTPAEAFCVRALQGARPKRGTWPAYSARAADKAFRAHPNLMPHTLADCVHELIYWHDLWHLRRAWPNSTGDGSEQVNAREWFVMRCLARIAPRTVDEALAAFKYLREHQEDRMALDEEGTGILVNLIKGPRPAPPEPRR